MRCFYEALVALGLMIIAGLLYFLIADRNVEIHIGNGERSRRVSPWGLLVAATAFTALAALAIYDAIPAGWEVVVTR